MDRWQLAYQDELQKAGMELVDGAVVKPNRGVSATEYTITGELENVLRAVKAIFDAYPPQGYGTDLKYMCQLSDGNYGARMGRANSCD